MDRVKFQGLAHTLLYKHKLTGWRIVLKSMKRLGLCSYDSRTLSFNEHHIEDDVDEEVINTLLHEIAHALVGPGHHHGLVWKAMAIQLGARPEVCVDVAVLANRPRSGCSWRAICPQCHRVYYKHKKPKYVTGYFCRFCGNIRGALTFLPHYEET